MGSGGLPAFRAWIVFAVAAAFWAVSDKDLKLDSGFLRDAIKMLMAKALTRNVLSLYRRYYIENYNILDQSLDCCLTLQLLYPLCVNV
jgi:hypothetical protein